MRSRRYITNGLVVAFLLLTPAAAFAQGSPWEAAAQALADAFTGIIGRSLTLVACVVAGLYMAFGEGGGKRTISGLIFGAGLALMAAQFLAWLYS